MATPDITVYWTPASHPARSIKVLVDFHGCTDKVKFQLVNLSEKEQLQPWFLELNPFHTVPTMKDATNNVVLTESTAIVEYLAKTFEWTGEWGVQDFNVVNLLHSYHNTVAKSASNIMRFFYMGFFGGSFDLAGMKAAVEAEKVGYFKTLNEILEKKGGFLTGTPSAADVHYWVFLYHLSVSKHGKDDFNTLHIYDFQDFPAIRKWMTALEAKFFNEELWQDVRDFAKAGSSCCQGIRLADAE